MPSHPSRHGYTDTDIWTLSGVSGVAYHMFTNGLVRSIHGHLLVAPTYGCLCKVGVFGQATSK